MGEPTLQMATKAVADLNVAFEAFKATNDENLKNRDAVLEAKLAKIEADMDAAQKIADEAVLAAKRASRIVTDGSGNEIDLDAKALNWARAAAKARGDGIDQFGHAEMMSYKRAFLEYLRVGKESQSADQIKALSVGSDPDGGYLVNPDMSGRIVTRVFETSPLRAFASVQAISTDRLEGVLDLGEFDAGWGSETAARGDTATSKVGRWSIAVNDLWAHPKITTRMLEDSAIDIEAWIANKVAEKFARTEANAFVVGDGADKPRGFLTYAGGTADGTIERFKSGVNGGFATDGSGADVLINALYGLKAQYRANAVWAMNRATTAAVRKIKDSDGAYIWQAGLAAGQPATLLGYPTASFEDMPALATGSLSIAIADWRATYQIVDRAGISVLRDPYTASPFVRFLTTKRVGGDVLNFESIKLIEFAA